MKKLLCAIKRFFPIQLLLGYLKRDYLFLFSWLILFLVVAGNLGSKFGMQFIFLSPEYLGHIGIWAFLFTGLGVGSFIMAFHISAYVVTAHRYPFIATLSRPFFVFSLNNSVIPGLYILLYIYESLKNQIYYEMIPVNQAIINIVFFIIGIILFTIFSFGFFFFVVKILPRIIRINKERLKGRKYLLWLTKWSEKEKEKKLDQSPEENTGNEKIEYYLGSNFRIKLSRKYGHYSKEYLTKAFRNQHIHALFFVIFLLSVIVIRGFFKDTPSLILPAGSSIHVIFTIILLLSSIFYIFFAEWSFFALLVIAFVLSILNPIYTEKYSHSAYGMNYTIKKAKIDPLEHGNYTKDSLAIINILNKWKRNEIEKNNQQKPRIIVVSASGGGMKLSIWTYFTLAYADSLTRGKLMENTRLITGASGGMFGAAYLREMYRETKEGIIHDFHDRKYLRFLSRDLLNPVLYGLSMSDWFPHFKKFRHGQFSYLQDRAYLFEQTVNRNTFNVLEKPISFYKKYEQNAEIPMLIITPSIMNVGTRMIISPLNLSFLTKSTVKKNVKNIEFRYNYRKFDADSLNFLSAIRMNASFPYITPFITLPGTPKIRVFDAGLNDNYGFLTAYDYLVEFHKWINSNTAGVIFINICENELIDYDDKSSAFYKLIEPVASLFNDWDIIQNSNNFSAISSLKQLFPNKFDIINLTFGNKKHKISLSWHLTEREKKYIFNAIKNTDNQKELQKLSNLLK